MVCPGNMCMVTLHKGDNDIIIIIVITASAVPEDSLHENNNERLRYIGTPVHRYMGTPVHQYNSIYVHELSQRIYSLRSVPAAQAAERILPGTSPQSAMQRSQPAVLPLPQTAASINMKLLKIQPRSETGVTPFCSPDSSDISLGKEFLLCQNKRIGFTLWVCRQDSTLTSANTVCSPPDLS